MHETRAWKPIYHLKMEDNLTGTMREALPKGSWYNPSQVGASHLACKLHVLFGVGCDVGGRLSSQIATTPLIKRLVCCCAQRNWKKVQVWHPPGQGTGPETASSHPSGAYLQQ